MFNPYIILIPLLATLVGWGTNYLAVMLFRPRKKIRIAGIEIQGVFLKDRCNLQKRLANWWHRSFFRQVTFQPNLKIF